MIKHLESEGLAIGDSLLYEAMKIPYGKTKIRNYIVDLTLPHLKVIAEIKPSARAENRNNTAKRVAAEKWASENGWQYLIITEQELQQCGVVLTLEQVATFDDVKLNERALRALRRKQALRKRKDKKNEIKKLRSL